MPYHAGRLRPSRAKAEGVIKFKRQKRESLRSPFFFQYFPAPGNTDADQMMGVSWSLNNE